MILPIIKTFHYQQGIVGKVYRAGDIVYDDQLQKTNSQNYASDRSKLDISKKRENAYFNEYNYAVDV